MFLIFGVEGTKEEENLCKLYTRISISEVAKSFKSYMLFLEEPDRQYLLQLSSHNIIF